ncbi:MAG TPA: hypothetical protein VHX43_10710 [Xanthobacteraceae bacterium]|jgi:hypothetical protein|nr:hypothetical protein [Xanthobacteraceae bacterium]
MGILLAYFVWVACTLAVIVTAWVGVADSGVDRLHLQRASVIQHSHDAAFMAEDDLPPAATAAAAAHSPAAHAVAHDRRTAARRPRQHGYDPRVALSLDPPPDDGH